ncbi:MAG TPA: hypothetical protein VFT22_17105 [Kofleriaceae bacterium]|nr:hypothetical protein [Kofleriaceae bacterium]
MLSTARADEPEESKPAAEASATAGEGADQLTLPSGRLLLNAFVEINLSTDLAFKPVSLSPDLWYGATPDITVGLIHSSVGASGFIGGVGDSLCLTGTDNGCSDLYKNVGLDVRYKLKNGQLAYAVDGGLYVTSFDPLVLALKAGGVARWHQGPLAVETAPNLFVGLTNRTTNQMAGGVTVEVTTNGEVFNLPVAAIYTVAPKIDVDAQTGVVLPFENTGDTYRVPFSIGGHFHVNESLNINAAFTLLAVVGGGSQTGFDGRTFTLGGTYAF